MADAASRPMKKGWVDRSEPEDVADAAEAAAERTRKSVKGERGSSENAMGRKPGPISMGLMTVGAAPLVAGHVVKDTVERAVKEYKRRKSPLYDKDEED